MQFRDTAEEQKTQLDNCRLGLERITISVFETRLCELPDKVSTNFVEFFESKITCKQLRHEIRPSEKLRKRTDSCLSLRLM